MSWQRTGVVCVGAFAVMFFGAQAAGATTRYVATAAHGGNNNGGANVCNNRAAPCLTVRQAVSAASGGDTILIGPGRFPEAVSATSKTLSFIGAGAGTTTSFNPATQTFVDAVGTIQPAFTTAKHSETFENLRMRGGEDASGDIEPAISSTGGSSDPPLNVDSSVLLQSTAVTMGGISAALDVEGGTGGANVSVAHTAVDGYLGGVQVLGATGSLSITSSVILSPAPSVMIILPNEGAVHSSRPVTIAGSLLTGLVGVNDTAQSTTVTHTVIKASAIGIDYRDNGNGPTMTVRDTVIGPAAGTLDKGILIVSTPPETLVPSIDLTFDTILARSSTTAHGLDVVNALAGTQVHTRNTILRAIDSGGGSGNDDIATGSQAINWDLGFTSYTQTSGVGVPVPGSGTNFDVVPHFVDDAGTNLRLQPSSTLFDKGDATSVLPGETDVVGLPRVLAHSCGAVPKPDIGAFESPAPSCPAPTVSLTSPANGASFNQGQAVTAAYTCAVASPAAISSCTGPTANGAKIDTSTPGSHTFTVTAIANDGASASATTTYTVKPPKPSLGKLHASHKSFREGSKLATIAKKKHKKPPVGTTLKFTLNTTATLKLVFGHKVKRPHHKTKTKTDGTIKLTGHPGTDKITFQGRINKHHKLKPGTYTITITANNSTGKSKTRTIKFTILKG
jgi:hypothetical protein